MGLVSGGAGGVGVATSDHAPGQGVPSGAGGSTQTYWKPALKAESAHIIMWRTQSGISGLTAMRSGERGPQEVGGREGSTPVQQV